MKLSFFIFIIISSVFESLRCFLQGWKDEKTLWWFDKFAIMSDESRGDACCLYSGCDLTPPSTKVSLSVITEESKHVTMTTVGASVTSEHTCTIDYRVSLQHLFNLQQIPFENIGPRVTETADDVHHRPKASVFHSLRLNNQLSSNCASVHKESKEKCSTYVTRASLMSCH